MPAGQSTVLKGRKVTVAGERIIGPGAAADAGTAPQPQGRIVQQTDAAAVVEIVCSCGKRLYLHCTYGPASGGGGQQAAEASASSDTADTK